MKSHLSRLNRRLLITFKVLCCDTLNRLCHETVVSSGFKQMSSFKQLLNLFDGLLFASNKNLASRYYNRSFQKGVFA